MALPDFFNTYLNPIKIMEGKREYKGHVERVKALPADYRFVFEKIQRYMWKHADGDGKDMMSLQYDLIGLFEEGAESNKHVLDITGEDVAGFCDELLKSVNTWTRSWPEKLNNDVIGRFGGSRIR